MSKSTNEHPNKLFRLSPARQTALLTVLLSLASLVSVPGLGQQVFYHLLGAGEVTVAFLTPSTTVNESVGSRHIWPVALNSWTKRRAIVLDGSSAPLANYPVLVKLDSTRVDYASVRPDGFDLRFADTAGNILSHEVESWVSGGTSWVWVKVPSLATFPARNQIYMYYGNAAAAQAQDSAGLWGTDHLQVLHLSGTTGAIANGVAVPASLGDAGTTQNGGSGMSYSAGVFGNAVTLDGVNDAITMGTSAALNFGANTPFSIAAFVKTTDAAGPLVVFRNSTLGNPVLGIYIGHNGASTDAGKATLLVRDGTSSTGYATLVGPLVNDGQWHLVAIQRNAGNQIELFVDGVSHGTASGAASGGAITTDMRRIGTDGVWVAENTMTADQRYLNGAVDEVRVAGKMLGATYYQALWSMRNDGMAYFMEEEDFSDGVISLVAQLSSAALIDLNIPYTVTGTATAGLDHTATPGTLSFLVGETSKTIRFRILRDDLVEPNETIVFTLVEGDGYGLGGNNPHVVTITDEVLSPPNAVDDNITITSLNPVSVPVLLNDDDPGGDFLTITSFTNPALGTVQRVADRFLYTPSSDFRGTDSFTYTISDGRGGTDTATVNLTYQIPFTWTGAGPDANWATGANWVGGSAPGLMDVAYFNDQCSMSCDPILPATIDIGGLSLNSSYSGTIVQGAGAIHFGGSGYIQRSGTFTGGASDISSDAGFAVLGGSFLSTATQLRNKSKDFRVAGTASFDANGGQILLECPYGTVCRIEPGTATYYEVIIAGRYANFDLASGAMKVTEMLSIGDTYGPGYTSQQINNGEFLVYGDYQVINNGIRGSATVRMMGRASGQTISGVTGKFMPRLKIEAGSQTVTFSGDVSVANNYTYSSGDVVTTGSTLLVHCDYGLTCPFVSGAVDYNNLRLSSSYGNFNLSGSVVSVLGQLTIGDNYGAGYLNQQLSNGTLNVRGAISISPYGYRGTAVINSLGGNSTISAGATVGVPQGTFTVNKDTAADILTFGSNVAFSGAGQAVNISQGIVNLAGYNLSVGGLLSIGTQGKLICNGGTVTAGSSNIQGEISCGSSLGITWTGLAGDGLWSTAGNWTENTVPGAGDVAIFSNICGGNCDVTIDTNISVRGIRMQSNYSGMITQQAGRTIAVSTAGWSQAGGAFNGSDAALSISQSFTLSGGTFRAPQTTWTLGRTVCGADRVLFDMTGGTFLHNNSFLRVVESRQGGMSCSNTYTFVYPAGLSFYDLELNSTATGGGWFTTVNPGGGVVDPLIVERDFYDYGPINNMSLRVRGDIRLANVNNAGSGKIILDGGSDQYIHTNASTPSQTVRVEKTTGSVLPAAGVTSIWVRSLEVIQGVFEAPTGVLRLGNVTGTSLSMNSLEVSGSATFHTNGGTVHFSLERNGSNNTFANIETPMGFEFENVQITSAAPGGGWYSNITATNPVVVNGSLAFLGMRTTATWIARGDVSIGGNAFGGSGQIRIAGGTDQTITGVSSGFAPNLVIESAGSDVHLDGTIVLRHNLTFTSGVVKAGTSHVVFAAATQNNSHSLGAIVLNDVTFNGYTYNHTLAGSMDVTGTLTIAGTSSSPTMQMNGGTIFAHGDVAFSSNGAGGSTIIRVAGSVDQTVSGVATAAALGLEVDSTGGTVGLSGTLNIGRGYQHLQGVVDAGGSSVVFNANGGTHSLVPLTTVFNNVGIAGFTATYNITGTLAANSTMTLSSSSSSPAQSINGALAPLGNLVLSASGSVGNAMIDFGGPTNSTLSRGSSAQLPTGAITVGKTGGASVSLLTNFISTVTGQDLKVASGVFDLNGNELGVPDHLEVAVGTTLRCNGGLFMALTTDLQGTIECPGYPTYPFNWTGATGDGNFATAGNWQGLAAPTATSVVVFDDAYCGANCNVALGGATSVRGVVMQSGYTGQFQQLAGYALTVGNRGWQQAGGAFIGSDAAIAIGTRFQVSGGAFTSTSGTMTLNRATTSIAAGATFNHSNGLVVFQQAMGWDMLSVNTGGKNLYDVRFSGDGDVALGSTLYVNRNLTMDISAYSAAIIGEAHIAGDMTVLRHESADRFIARLIGAAAQTITTSGVAGDVSTRVGRLIVDKPSGSVTVVGDVMIHGIEHISGAVAFNPSANVVISHYDSSACSTLDVITPGNIQFPNVGINGCGPRSINGTLNVGGDLGIDLYFNAAGLRNGKIAVAGNYSLVRDENYSSSTEIEMVGGSDTTISIVSGYFNPGNLTVSKTAGAKVSLVSNVVVRNGSSDVAILSGELDLAGYSLTVGNASGTDNTLTIGAGATLRRSGGTYTAEAVVNNGQILP